MYFLSNFTTEKLPDIENGEGRKLAMKAKLVIIALTMTLGLISTINIQAQTIPVTPDNFARAETDMYFAQFAKSGGFGKFNHARNLPLGEDTGVRPNRDTLYSLAVFDLDAEPVTIT